MYPNRLQYIFILSIILNYVHGVECVMTKFYESAPHFTFFTDIFSSIPQTVYYVFHGSFWLFILLVFLLMKGGKWAFIPLALYGSIFFTEYHHFIKGVFTLSYYPGMITSFFFPIIGYFYWKEIIIFCKSTKSK